MAELAKINDPKANKVMRNVIEPRRQGGKQRRPCKSALSNSRGRCSSAAGMLIEDLL